MYTNKQTFENKLRRIIKEEYINLLYEDSDAKVKNPETGRMIKATTALSYGVKHPAYSDAKKILNKEHEPDVEIGQINSKDKKAVAVSRDKIKSIGSSLNKLKDLDGADFMRASDNIQSDFRSISKYMDSLSQSKNKETNINAHHYTKPIVNHANKIIDKALTGKLSPTLEKTLLAYKDDLNKKQQQIEDKSK